MHHKIIQILALHFSTSCIRILRSIQNPSKPRGLRIIWRCQPTILRTTQTPKFHEQNLPKHPPNDKKKIQPYPLPKNYPTNYPASRTKTNGNSFGRLEMVLNLTNFQFSAILMEVLDLGQKYATGIYKNITTNIIHNNYRKSDTDFSKGSIQGIILTGVFQTNESSLPKYIYR